MKSPLNILRQLLDIYQAMLDRRVDPKTFFAAPTQTDSSVYHAFYSIWNYASSGVRSRPIYFSSALELSKSSELEDQDVLLQLTFNLMGAENKGHVKLSMVLKVAECVYKYQCQHKNYSQLIEHLNLFITNELNPRLPTLGISRHLISMVSDDVVFYNDLCEFTNRLIIEIALENDPSIKIERANQAFQQQLRETQESANRQLLELQFKLEEHQQRQLVLQHEIESLRAEEKSCERVAQLQTQLDESRVYCLNIQKINERNLLEQQQRAAAELASLKEQIACMPSRLPDDDGILYVYSRDECDSIRSSHVAKLEEFVAADYNFASRYLNLMELAANGDIKDDEREWYVKQYSRFSSFYNYLFADITIEDFTRDLETKFDPVYLEVLGLKHEATVVHAYRSLDTLTYYINHACPQTNSEQKLLARVQVQKKVMQARASFAEELMKRMHNFKTILEFKKLVGKFARRNEGVIRRGIRARLQREFQDLEVDTLLSRAAEHVLSSAASTSSSAAAPGP